MRLPRSGGILLHPTSFPGPNGIGEIGPEDFGRLAGEGSFFNPGFRIGANNHVLFNRVVDDRTTGPGVSKRFGDSKGDTGGSAAASRQESCRLPTAGWLCVASDAGQFPEPSGVCDSFLWFWDRDLAADAGLCCNLVGITAPVE